MKNNPKSYGVSAVPKLEWQWVSLPLTAPSGIPGDLPVVFTLAKYRGSAWWNKYFPRSYGIEIRITQSLRTAPQ